MSYLNPGLPKPAPMPDGRDAPFWEAAAEGVLKFQRCNACNRWQWGPEWICHRCYSDDLAFEAVAPADASGTPHASAVAEGRIYSFERVWHPVHPALKDQGPYIVVLVEFPDHDGVRIVGNLLGDPEQEVEIGSTVRAVFEHHADEDPPFTLVQWEVV